MKRCGYCKDYLEENEFSWHKGRLQSFCKNCQSEYAKKYRQKNKEKLVQRVRDWRKSNKSNRSLNEKQKLEEEFRAKIRRLVKKEDDIVDSIFGYSPKSLRKYLLDKFGQLPNKEYNIKYREPLKNFDLTDLGNWRVAAQFENLEIVKKST